MEDQNPTESPSALDPKDQAFSDSPRAFLPPGLAEEALRMVSDPVGIVDKNLKIVWANPAWISSIKPPLQDPNGHYCRDVCRDCTGSCDESCPVVEAFKTGKVSAREHLVQLPNGICVRSEIQALPVFDGNGEVTHAVHYVRDIKEFRNGAQDIRTKHIWQTDELKNGGLPGEQTDGLSNAHYRSLVESARDIICTISPKGIITSLNPAFEMVTGWPYTDRVGKHFNEIIQPDDWPIAQEIFSQVLDKKKSCTHELHVLSKSGRYLVAEFTTTPHVTQGKIVGVMSISRDITDRKQIDLERLQAVKLESIGTLAGGIAHDFNNILTAVLGNIALARIYVRHGDKAFERIVEAEKASLRAKDLAQQLLTFAKGGGPVKKVVSIPQLLHDCVSFALRGSNVKCDFHIDDNIHSVKIDEGQIKQVINHLVINSQEAMPKGGIIEVHAENVAPGQHKYPAVGHGDYVRISVKDHGSGIPKKNLERVFDPYFTTKQKGSGLGLATTYSIIRRHNGYVHIESEIGAGTAVTVYLPVFRKKTVPAEAEKQAFSTSLSGKGRILVMDDEEIVRTVASEILSYLGYEVDLAHDGLEALEAYRKAKVSGNSFAAVIMDLTVPGGMGGKETVRKLLEMDPQVKAIVSSGYSNDPIMSDFERAGFCGVIPKPYKIREIGEVLQTVLAEG